MKKLFLIALNVWVCSNMITTQKILACVKDLDCNEDEICVSYYDDCQKKQIKRCISRSCYRSGVGCPEDLVCNDKHCSVLGCKP